MEINAAYGGSTDIAPIVSAIVASGLPKLTSLGIHLQFDEAEYPLGDLSTLLTALTGLEELEARGSLDGLMGVPTLQTLRLQLTPLSPAALASFEAAVWPALVTLSLRNDGRPFPEDFDVRRDAAELNELQWPQPPLPKLTAKACPKLEALELHTGGDAFNALQQLASEPALLRGLTSLTFSAGYISRRSADLLLEHASSFCEIDELEIEGIVGWAIGPQLAEKIEAAIPALMGMQPNIAFAKEELDAPAESTESDEAEETGDRELQVLFECEEFAKPWFRSTAELELSVSTQAAIARCAPDQAFMLGVMGQFTPARLLADFGWTMQNVFELRELLSHFGIVLGEPISAWNLELGRSLEAEEEEDDDDDGAE